MDYSNICYKKTCLSQVIIRIDFFEFIDNSSLFNSSAEKKLISNFPQKGMQQSVRFQTMNLTIGPKGSKTENQTQEGVQQEFSSYEGNKIIISNKYVIHEINNYTKFEVEMDRLIPVLKALMQDKQLTSVRTGIRYINIFNRLSLTPQKSYFKGPASALADIKLMDGASIIPIRSMALNEYIVEDMRLNFRYGQYNERYPQPMKTKAFVLDYDCFCGETLTGLNSIIEHINKGHDAIQDLFENTITEKLRKEMLDG